MDNNGALAERVVQTMNRLNVVNNALLKAEPDDALERAMFEFARFFLCSCSLSPSYFAFRKLVDEAVMLKGMSSSPIWEKIIENEQNAEKIEGSFKRLDEHTKDFQVRAALQEPRVY